MRLKNYLKELSMKRSSVDFKDYNDFIEAKITTYGKDGSEHFFYFEGNKMNWKQKKMIIDSLPDNLWNEDIKSLIAQDDDIWDIEFSDEEGEYHTKTKERGIAVQLFAALEEEVC